ncbi:hypothetical protein, partial [uncultured Sutterella sp.]
GIKKKVLAPFNLSQYPMVLEAGSLGSLSMEAEQQKDLKGTQASRHEISSADLFSVSVARKN